MSRNWRPGGAVALFGGWRLFLRMIVVYGGRLRRASSWRFCNRTSFLLVVDERFLLICWVALMLFCIWRWNWLLSSVLFVLRFFRLVIDSHAVSVAGWKERKARRGLPMVMFLRILWFECWWWLLTIFFVFLWVGLSPSVETTLFYCCWSVRIVWVDGWWVALVCSGLFWRLRGCGPVRIWHFLCWIVGHGLRYENCLAFYVGSNLLRCLWLARWRLCGWWFDWVYVLCRVYAIEGRCWETGCVCLLRRSVVLVLFRTNQVGNGSDVLVCRDGWWCCRVWEVVFFVECLNMKVLTCLKLFLWFVELIGFVVYLGQELVVAEVLGLFSLQRPIKLLGRWLYRQILLKR